MKPNALKNYIILDRLDDQGDNLFYDSSLAETRWCKVLNTGPGLPDLNANIQSVSVNAGDVVYFMNKGIHDVNLAMYGNTEPFSVASELDGLCVLTDTDPTSPKIQPLGDWIEVKKMEYDTVLNVPDKAVVSNIGVVKSVGPGLKSLLGGHIPVQVKVGDVVVFNPFNTVLVDFKHIGSSEKTILISEGSIMAVLQ